MDGPELVFLPCAGFGNRMRSIASALVAAEEVGRPLRIVWTCQRGIFTSSFNSVFQGYNLPSWVQIDDIGINPEPFWRQAKLVRNAEEWEANKTRPVLKSYYAFYKEGTPRWLEFLRMFKIAPDIRRRQELIFGNVPVGQPVIGVHIRRTDHTKCIEKSPSELFWEVMDTYPSTTIFFVASDSLWERELLHARYQNRILTGPEELLGRDDPFGCLDAILDFYCLSQCDEILGSFSSSFSEVSAQYGGVKLRPITKEKS